jgi:hypothetical protein
MGEVMPPPIASGFPEAEILESTLCALECTKAPRLFKTERGYHGEFYCQLRPHLSKRGIITDSRHFQMAFVDRVR